MLRVSFRCLASGLIRSAFYAWPHVTISVAVSSRAAIAPFCPALLSFPCLSSLAAWITLLLLIDLTCFVLIYKFTKASTSDEATRIHLRVRRLDELVFL